VLSIVPVLMVAFAAHRPDAHRASLPDVLVQVKAWITDDRVGGRATSAKQLIAVVDQAFNSWRRSASDRPAVGRMDGSRTG
jgi:hypothetical protein